MSPPFAPGAPGAGGLPPVEARARAGRRGQPSVMAGDFVLEIELDRLAPRAARRPTARRRRARPGTATGSARRSSSAARTARGDRRRRRRLRLPIAPHPGPAPGQQDAAHDGPERLRLDVRSRAGGDRPGDHVRLLGREAALLDRERRASPRPTRLDARHPAESVRRHEPSLVAGDAAASAGRPPGKGDHALPASARAPARRRGARLCRRHRAPVRTRTRASSRSVASAADPLGPKIASGAGSGVYTVISTSSWPIPRSVPRRHQRELVGRQRPATPSGITNATCLL